MKKTTIVLLTLLSCSTFAQLGKGKKIISGSFGILNDSRSEKFKAGSTDEDKKFYSNLDLIGGIFLNDKFAFGLHLGHDYSKFDLKQTPNKSTITNSELAVGLFGRFYKPTDLDRLALMFHFTGDFIGGGRTNKANTSGTSVNTKSKIAGFGLSFTPGVAFLLSDHFAVETFYGNLGFITSKEKVKTGATEVSTVTNNDFSLDFTMQSLHFGVSYFF